MNGSCSFAQGYHPPTSLSIPGEVNRQGDDRSINGLFAAFPLYQDFRLRVDLKGLKPLVKRVMCLNKGIYPLAKG
jgi:hypothetical protein